MEGINSLVNIARNPFKRLKQWIFNQVLDSPHLSEQEKEEFRSKWNHLENEEVNILLIGGTGVGKSSTINALFQTEGKLTPPKYAKVGYGPDPETQSIDRYSIGNLRIWDSPGVGESPKADVIHKRQLVSKIKEQDANGKYLIDLVLVVLDGGTRDYGSTFDLLRFLSPYVEKSRILVGINKIDHIKHGYGWNEQDNKPTVELQKLIDQKVASVKRRIKDSSGLSIEPIPYCAGSIDEFDPRSPYGISELLTNLVVAIPDKKRIAMISKVKEEAYKNINKQQKAAITEKTKKSLSDSKLGSTIARLGIAAATGFLFGGCFITTAVCDYKGKKDNCFMLNLFRNFRDYWLVKQPGGVEVIKKYYLIAPDIVRWIESKQNKAQIYEEIYADFLLPCYRLLKKREYNQCWTRYEQMVIYLEKRKEDELC